MMALSASSNPQLAGKYRLIRLSVHGINTAYISSGFENPWLSKEAAIENAEKIAAAKGWQEVELTKWTKAK